MAAGLVADYAIFRAIWPHRFKAIMWAKVRAKGAWRWIVTCFRQIAGG